MYTKHIYILKEECACTNARPYVSRSLQRRALTIRFVELTDDVLEVIIIKNQVRVSKFGGCKTHSIQYPAEATRCHPIQHENNSKPLIYHKTHPIPLNAVQVSDVCMHFIEKYEMVVQNLSDPTRHEIHRIPSYPIRNPSYVVQNPSYPIYNPLHSTPYTSMHQVSDMCMHSIEKFEMMMVMIQSTSPYPILSNRNPSHPIQHNAKPHRIPSYRIRNSAKRTEYHPTRHKTHPTPPWPAQNNR